MRLALLIPFLLFAVQSDPEKGSVELYQIEREGLIEIHGKNFNEYSVTVEVDLELTNMRSNKINPFTMVLAPKSDVKLTELVVKRKDKGWSYETSYGFQMGDIFAKHLDSYEYQLPYQLGTEHRVSQAYNGEFSHKGETAFSIDFDMPEGTKIFAARSGVVVDVQESYSKGGTSSEFLDKANYVTVVHNDGTFSEYSHLKKNGVLVSLGQRVRTGQLLGFSGATGYATGPHLHFNVKKAVKGGSFETIPTKFKIRGSTKTIEKGKSYKAL